MSSANVGEGVDGSVTEPITSPRVGIAVKVGPGATVGCTDAKFSTPKLSWDCGEPKEFVAAELPPDELGVTAPGVAMVAYEFSADVDFPTCPLVANTPAVVPTVAAITTAATPMATLVAMATPGAAMAAVDMAVELVAATLAAF